VVAVVVVVGGVNAVGEVELSVHCLERAYELRHGFGVAEVHERPVAVAVAAAHVFAVTHVLHTILVAFYAFNLPNLAECGFRCACPSGTVVYNLHVVVCVVLVSEPVAQLYAVVSVFEAAVAVGLVSLGYCLERFERSGVFFFVVSLFRIV